MIKTFFSAALVAGQALAYSAEPSYTTKRPPISTIEPAASSIAAAQASIQPSSPTSNVKGAAFDRIIQIWLENTDFAVASGDPNMQWIASQGITLTNYFAGKLESTCRTLEP
jgi:acid phosphatase